MYKMMATGGFGSPTKECINIERFHSRHLNVEMKITADFATINNASLYFEMAGTGKPLLLLHSGIADHRMWEQQWYEFSRYFQVIMPDLRGYGKSPAPVAPFLHYEDIHGLIQHLGLKSVNLAGSSLGGKTAIEIALAYPETVDSLVLIAPGLIGYEYQDGDTLAKDTILAKLIASGRREEVADMLVNIWVVGLKRSKEIVDSAVQALVRGMILDNYDSVVDKFPETTSGIDMISRLGEIHVPALVMVGDSDLPDMQAISQIISARIPGAKKQVITDAAHLPNLEHGSLFNKSVLDFLAVK
jgi:pimeloyl-ACP methyl ester carboxylesterase